MMDGIYIAGLEMPKACFRCELYENDGYWCRAAKREIEDPFAYEGISSFCPLVPVPDHGDLIARDDLVAAYDAEHAGHPGRARELMMEAPTVIPAKKEDE